VELKEGKSTPPSKAAPRLLGKRAISADRLVSPPIIYSPIMNGSNKEIVKHNPVAPIFFQVNIFNVVPVFLMHRYNKFSCNASSD
jgi:hypothetical protein